MTEQLWLGASLYVPATRTDLLPIALGERYPHLRSAIFCTEDGILPADLPLALDHLRLLLAQLAERGGPAGGLPGGRAPLRFVRVRSPQVLRQLLDMPAAGCLDGFVLPKVTGARLPDYLDLLEPGSHFRVMLTLETVEVFDVAAMTALRDLFLEGRYRQRILALRIGGNDLLGLLGLRRPRRGTIYDTPLGGTIGQLVTLFRPHGFALTGPVFDRLDDDAGLVREVRRDLAFGLFGKTAVHPRQVPLIEAAYRVCPEELQLARRILERGPAVFRHAGAMCEPSTQQSWASLTLARAELFGLAEPPRASRTARQRGPRSLSER